MLFKVSAVAAATSAVILSTVSADPSIGVTETALVSDEEAVESAASASFADSYVPHKMLKAAKKEEERVQSAVLRNGKDNYNPKEAPVENEEELLENDPAKFFGILDHRNLQEQFDCSSCSSRPSVGSYDDLYDAFTSCYGRNTTYLGGYVAPVPADCPYDVPANCWDVSGVSKFSYVLYKTNFNAPLNCWDMSSATNVSGMLAGNYYFEQDISMWDLSNVETMTGMLYDAHEFTGQNLNEWNTAKVADMSYLFSYNYKLTASISDWDTSSVTDMTEMFLYAEEFNNPLPWVVSKVKSTNEMLFGAYKFNQNIEGWDTASLTEIGKMFHTARAFNQDLNNFNVSQVTNMEYMFTYAEKFNQPLNLWDVSNVEDMRGMFDAAVKFNQDISNWNIKNVKNFTQMFDGAKEFNQPIGGWNPASANEMDFMFFNATKFNQCLGLWALATPNDVQVTDMFTDSSCTNTTDPDPNAGPWCQTKADKCSDKRTVIPFVNRDGDGNPICEDLPRNVRFNPIFGKDDRNRPDDYVPPDEDADPDDKQRQNCESLERLKNIRQLDKWCNSDALIRSTPAAYKDVLPKLSYVKLYNLCPKSCRACADTCTDSRQAFTVTTDESKTNRRCTYLDKQKEATAARLCRKREIELKRGRIEFRIKPLMEQCPRTCGKLGSGKCAAFLEDSSDSGDERRI